MRGAAWAYRRKRFTRKLGRLIEPVADAVSDVTYIGERDTIELLRPALRPQDLSIVHAWRTLLGELLSVHTVHPTHRLQCRSVECGASRVVARTHHACTERAAR